MEDNFTSFLIFLDSCEVRRARLAGLDLGAIKSGGVTKQTIRRCLMYVVSHAPDACPDRNLMKQVNRFFLTTGRFAELHFSASPDPWPVQPT